MDDIELLGCDVSRYDIEQADAISDNLGVMEGQLPDSYCFPGEMPWTDESGTVASALERLLMRKERPHDGQYPCVSLPWLQPQEAEA